MKTFNGRFTQLCLAVLSVPTYFTQVVASPTSTNVVVPFTAVGDVTAIQSVQGNGDTRLYSQNSAGDIVQTCVSNAFTNDTTHTTCGADSFDVIVPANQTLHGTPIAAVDLTGQAGTYGEIHLYFVSPDYVLSEYIYQAGTGFRGGPSCTDCITTQGFKVVEGSQVLYAMGSSTTSRKLRVGFISQGAPETISEAVNDGTNWQTAGLPN